MNNDWTKDEVRDIVEDYFQMLGAEIGNIRYNKSEHRRVLSHSLNNRSEGSIEFKHQNISAALINMGLPFIKGYKPRFNYQKLAIEEEIIKYINKNKDLLENEFEYFSSEPVKSIQNNEIDFTTIIDNELVESKVSDGKPTFRPLKINYLEKEQNNRSLGEAGEELVIRYEKWRLIKAGKESLSDRIEWVSKEQGDGAGFDILSKNINGSDRFIEVKTTKLSKDTPIYLTRTELSFASMRAKDFFLYRVFDFNTAPQMFIRNGNYESFCHLIGQTYKGYF